MANISHETNLSSAYSMARRINKTTYTQVTDRNTNDKSTDRGYSLTVTLKSHHIFLLPLLLLLTLTSKSQAQTTTIAIGSTAVQPAVKRLGINLGTLDFYDSGQTSQNLLIRNPGFEGQIWNSTIRCMSGTPTSCVDDDQWSGWPADFWDGATFEVIYGTAVGRTGTVTSSTAPGAGAGVSLNFGAAGTSPAAGDYLIVRKRVPGGAAGGWWPATSGAGTITDNLTDLPPGTLGKQTVALSAPGTSDTASISAYFDSTPAKTFVQLNGTYKLEFKAKGLSGSNQINVLVVRNGVANYLNQKVTLTGAWNTYDLTFSAAETGSAVGIVGVTFSTEKADSFELDDVSLTTTTGNPTNTTAYRDPVVATIKTLQPGILRYWNGVGQLGETLDNLLMPQFGRQRAGYSAWETSANDVSYGLHDFLQLCQSVGAEPWFVVPSTFSTTDASNLMEYLAGSASTPYGAKRAALGQVAPWSAVFPTIHLEFGNEAWNSTFKGGSIEYSAPYGQRAQAIFGAMRSNASYASSSFDLVLGGQAVAPGRNADIQNNCNNNDSFAVAPYTMNTVDSYSDVESLYGSTFAEPEALTSKNGTAEGLSPGLMYQDSLAIQGSSHPVPLSIYEINMSTLGGSINQQTLNSYVSSLGAGLMVVDTMLQSMRLGVINQNLFALPQYEFKRPDGSSVYLWGSVIDMGVTDIKRPQFLALQLANSAISNGATMIGTVHSGADPTWNQPLVNTVQMNGAHDLQSFAFANGSNHSLIVFNLSRTTALPVAFGGSTAPTGAVQMQQLTSANPSDNNENGEVVRVTSSTLNNFNPASGLSLPPYSMTVLQWSGSTFVAGPAISSLKVSAVSASGVTISWTTDQPSSTQVNYGATASYGSASPLDPALVLNHSVTLTGLAANSSYDFQAVSVTSTGLSAQSGNTLFSTTSAAAGPQVGYVVSWGISGSGATVTWSTDQPANTQLAYGTTQALGTLSPVQPALTASHGVVLTGLSGGATYYYVAQSTNAAGVTGRSAIQSFSTSTSGTPSAPAAGQSTAPQVGYVAFWGITDSGVTISWSSDQLATTAVSFGTSSSLGQLATISTNLSNNHGAVLSGLIPGTTYYFVVQSANASGATGSSQVYSFTTKGTAR